MFGNVSNPPSLKFSLLGNHRASFTRRFILPSKVTSTTLTTRASTTPFIRTCRFKSKLHLRIRKQQTEMVLFYEEYCKNIKNTNLPIHRIGSFVKLVLLTNIRIDPPKAHSSILIANETPKGKETNEIRVMKMKLNFNGISKDEDEEGEKKLSGVISADDSEQNLPVK